MPFSFSRSPESMTRSWRSPCPPTALVWRSMASTRVVLPWSTWATIATLHRSLRAVELMKKEGPSGGLKRVLNHTIVRAAARVHHHWRASAPLSTLSSFVLRRKFDRAAGVVAGRALGDSGAHDELRLLLCADFGGLPAPGAE